MPPKVAATHAQQVEALRTLAKSDPNLALRRAACAGITEIVEEVAHRYKDTLDIDGKSSNGHTALMWAAKNGHEACVAHLIALGSNRIGADRVATNNNIRGLIRGATNIGIAGNNSSTTFSWRFANIYAHMQKHLPAKGAHVLVIGPGGNNGTSPQMAELAVTNPQARFDVVEYNASICDTLKSGLKLTSEHAQDIHDVFAKTRFLPEAGMQPLHDKISQAPCDEILPQSVNVIHADLMQWVPKDQTYDAIVATHSIHHARRSLELSEGQAGLFASGPLFDGLLSSLRTGGWLYTDFNTAQQVDVVLDTFRSGVGQRSALFERTTLSAPVAMRSIKDVLDNCYPMIGTGNRLLLTDTIGAYHKLEHKRFFPEFEHMTPKDAGAVFYATTLAQS